MSRPIEPSSATSMSSMSLQDRLARLAVLVVVQVLDLLATAFGATSCRASATDPSWWYPIAGRLTVAVLVWAIVLRLPVGAVQSTRLVQGVTLLLAASAVWNIVLLSTC